MGLLLHCGAHAATREEVGAVPTPPPTKTHHPINHLRLMDMVKEKLPETGFQIAGEEHALNAGGAVYFGLLEIAHDEADEVGFMVGVRNSHNKSLASSLVFGHHVFVCDNLAFSGEERIGRKHTVNILRDLPKMVGEAVRAVGPMRDHEVQRMATYKDVEVPGGEADHFIMDLFRGGAISSSQIGKVWENWDTPPVEQFEEPTIWSMFNAATDTLKTQHPGTIYDKSRRLTEICDKRALLYRGPFFQAGMN